MAYTCFHQPDPNFKDRPPAFYDTDGSPVYENISRGLSQTIIVRNDVPALHSYNDNPRMHVFLREYEFNCDNPFSVASSCGSFDVLRVLIQMYPSSLDMSTREPLEEYLNLFEISLVHSACAAANREMLLWLLNRDPPLGTLHGRDAQGQTPLFCAALALGNAKPNSGEPTERQRQLEELIGWLLDSGCSVSDSDILKGDYSRRPQGESELISTVLGAAVPYATYGMTSRLIANGADIHAGQSWCDGQRVGIEYGERVTALHIAARSLNSDSMQAILDHRGGLELAEMVSIRDSDGRIPLHWALSGNCDFVEDQPYEITLRIMKAVKLLLHAKPDIVNARDNHGATVFHYILKSGMANAAILQVVKLLLDFNPLSNTLNARDNLGKIALGDTTEPYFFPCGPLDQFLELVDILLEKGADARVCDSKGRSILHILSSNPWTDSITPIMLDRLLEFVDVNQTDTDGYTALHYLVRKLNQIDAVRHLILRGADVNTIDQKGNTPLHHVMDGKTVRQRNQIGHLEPKSRDPERNELIRVLLNAGASMYQPNAAGQTPQQVLNHVLESQEREKREVAARRLGRARGGGFGRGRGRGAQ